MRYSFAARLCLCVKLFGLLLLQSAAAGDPLLILYYKKTRDSNRVIDAINSAVATDLPNSQIVSVDANPYYEERELGTNAVYCGELTSQNDVKIIVETLIDAGVELRYIGPFLQPEINRVKNIIDIRSVGDEEFYNNFSAISKQEIPWDELKCGYFEGRSGFGIFGKRVRLLNIPMTNERE
jgi:hypothetical protein